MCKTGRNTKKDTIKEKATSVASQTGHKPPSPRWRTRNQTASGTIRNPVSRSDGSVLKSHIQTFQSV